MPDRFDPLAGSLEDLRASLAEFYTGSSVVSVHLDGNPSELVLQRDAEPWDGMELFVFGNEGGSNARLVARLDNLGKGASGAAIQNLNLMCGLPETTGLSL